MTIYGDIAAAYCAGADDLRMRYGDAPATLRMMAAADCCATADDGGAADNIRLRDCCGARRVMMMNDSE
jgi:hypothetical protein